MKEAGLRDKREQELPDTPLPDSTLKTVPECNMLLQKPKADQGQDLLSLKFRVRKGRGEKSREDVLPGAWSSWSSGKRSSRVSLLESESFSSWQGRRRRKESHTTTLYELHVFSFILTTADIPHVDLQTATGPRRTS